MIRALLALSFLSLAACDNPCLQLANKICDCETDVNTQASCRNQVSIDASNVNPTVTKDDEAYCKSKLDGCTCNALLRGEREKCGFRKE